MWVVIGVMKESWNAELHPPSSINQIVSNAKKYSETVVVTGEPLMWDMTLLTQTLKENGRKVHIETSGAYPLTGHGIGFVYLKENKLPTQAVYDNAHELKVIIFNKHDFVLRKNKRKSK
jgi:organic radical activating enzyme